MQEQRAGFYELVWNRAAEALNAEVTRLDDNMLRISVGESRANVWRNYTCLDDPITLRIAGNKPLVLGLLQDVSVPTPGWATFPAEDLRPALQFMTGQVCVVKPARNTGAGSGVTTGVSNPRQLRRASAIAGAFDDLLLIEQQVAGDNYRLLFLDGVLLEAVHRKPPSLEGDGRSSIRQLIQQENRLRLREGWRRAQTLLTVDDDLKQTLAQQHLSLASRLEVGKRINLKTVINENRAAENVRVEDIDSSVVSVCRTAAETLGVRLAGVDVVTTDINMPLEQTQGVVLEVNTTPGLYHHYDPAEDHCRVAEAILAASLSESARRRSPSCQFAERGHAC